MKIIFFAFAILAVVIGRGECGECPKVSTVADLDYKRFAGKWYSMHESSPPRLPCLHYNIVSDAVGNLNITFLPYHAEAQGIRNDLNDVSKGFTMKIFQPDLDGADNQVIATDYEDWAVVFDCKEADPVKKSKLFYSVTFWSRTRSMTKETIEHIKQILDGLGVKYDTLKPMIQPDAACSVAETLFGPALGFFVSFLT